MRYVSGVVQKRFRNNSILFLLVVALFSSCSVVVATSSQLSAQTAEIRATVDNPTVVITVTSIQYLSIHNQFIARITVSTRFADTVRVYLSGNLVASQPVPYSDEWMELTFDVVLPNDLEYDVMLQASNASASTVAETIVQAQYPQNPDDTDTNDTNETTNPWWPLPPNTGELFIGTPKNIVILTSGVLGFSGILILLIRRRSRNSDEK